MKSDTSSNAPQEPVKCVVWDLDDTLWEGVLLEGDNPVPSSLAMQTIQVLDERGILHAVASRGNYDHAVAHLEKVGLLDYFVYIGVGWNAKSEVISRAAETLNIGLNAFAFVDNDLSEIDEVASALPQVRCYPTSDISDMVNFSELNPKHVTPEAAKRRMMYQAEQRRREDEEKAGAYPAEFLAQLGLVMTVRSATEEDLVRASELTVRTHQLNTTGNTYSSEELRVKCHEPSQDVLVARLEDYYGTYGTIGLALGEISGNDYVLKLLLMSCRVVSRGIGSALLGYIIDRAKVAGLRPCAEFVPNSANRIMLVNLRFAGFVSVDDSNERLFLVYEPPNNSNSATLPSYVDIHAEEVRVLDRNDSSLLRGV